MQSLTKGTLAAAVLGLTVCGLRAQPAPALTSEDVGVTLQGSTARVGEVVTVEGGGADIWGTADAFHYAYFQVSGDFDYIFNVEDLVGNPGDGGWSKVMLMARNFDATAGFPQPGDPHISNMTTRKNTDNRSTTATAAPNGVNVRGPQWRARRDNASSWTAPNPAYPPNYPDGNWIRLERVGDTFWMYTGNDGVSWNGYNPYVNQGWNTADSWPQGADSPAVSTFTNAWPNTILLGIAITAHSGNDLTRAVLSDFKQWTPVPIQITQQPPATLDLPANSSLSLSVEATGDPLHYQWLKDGVPIAASQEAPSAVSSTYTVELAQLADSGTYTVRLFGANQTTVTSSPTVVTITQDTTPPTMTRAVAAPSRTGVTINFSEPVTAPTATTPGNYTIAGLTVTSAVLSADPRQVVLTTSQQALDTQYTITVNNVQDNAGNPIAPNSTIVFNSVTFMTGLVQWERWNTPGGIVAFINAFEAGEMGPPDVTWTTGLFESGRGLGDNYRARGYAWFIPPQTGNYRFIITADDNARFFLSTDASPVNKKLTAAEGGWSNFREWSNATEEQDSATWVTPLGGDYGEPEWDDFPIPLQAGQSYYMEAFWQEGGGGDGCEVTWTFFGDPRPANGTVSELSGERIGSFVDPTTLPPVISSPAANSAVTVAGGATQTLSVVATGATSYQWQRNGVDIPGATSADYVIANANATHSGQYWCFVGNENAALRSPLINVLVTATGVFAIEAEDFDYDGGQSLPEASVMPYLGGAYAGLSAIHGVDYFSDNAADSPVYRGGAVLEAGTAAPMAAEGPGSQFSMTRMGEWEMTTNYKIGWIGAGDWGNYTRTFPTPAQTYWVLAAQSFDGTGANQLNSNLGRVTAGVGTASQTIEPLGRFLAPGTAGWSRNNLVAMTDDAGAIKTVQLGGQHTIRWNYDSGDVDYLVFVPATVPDQPGAAQIVISANNVVISEDPPGASTVQSAPAITGPWTNVGASPQTVPIEGAARYFRLTR